MHLPSPALATLMADAMVIPRTADPGRLKELMTRSAWLRRLVDRGVREQVVA